MVSRRGVGCIVAVAILLLPMLGCLPAAAGRVAITYTNWQAGGDMMGVTGRIIEGFEARYPDIKVEYLPLAWTGETGYLEKIMVWAAGDALPDVINIPYSLLPQLAEQGILQPLDVVFERDAQEIKLSDFVPLSLEATNWQGKTYGLPFDLSLWWVNYNRDAFAEAGVEEPVALCEKGSWTWDAMIKAASRLTRRGPDSKVEQWGLWTFPGDAGTYPWLWAFGGDLLSSDGTRARISEPQSVAGIAHLHSLMYEDQVVTFPSWTGIPNGADWGDTVTRGAFGMQPWWNTLISDYAGSGVKWQYDQVPLPPGPADPNTIPTHIHTVALTTGSKQVKAASEFIKYVTGDGYNPFSGLRV